MGLELRVRVGEMQDRHPPALRRFARDRAFPCMTGGRNGKAERRKADRSHQASARQRRIHRSYLLSLEREIDARRIAGLA